MISIPALPITPPIHPPLPAFPSTPTRPVASTTHWGVYKGARGTERSQSFADLPQSSNLPTGSLHSSSSHSYTLDFEVRVQLQRTTLTTLHAVCQVTIAAPPFINFPLYCMYVYVCWQMARMLLVLAVVAVCAALVSGSCKKFCDHPDGGFGQYLCCDRKYNPRPTPFPSLYCCLIKCCKISRIGYFVGTCLLIMVYIYI